MVFSYMIEGIRHLETVLEPKSEQIRQTRILYVALIFILFFLFCILIYGTK